MRAQKPAGRYRHRLDRISVPEALKPARTWQLTEDRPNKRQIVECPDDMHCVWSFDDGYRIKHLNTVMAFLRESKILRNCLHDVDQFLGFEVLSLRDPDNQPHTAIEFRNDLLIQIRGRANSALQQKYHPYLLAYLTNRGVPESEIIARLGLIYFNGEAHLDIDHCVQAFSNWVMALQYPNEIPFMHQKKIREFPNIYARYGKSARPKTREVVISHFKPRRRFLWNRLASDKRVPGDVQVLHPKLPGALYHLARYDAAPQDTVEYVYRKAIRQLLDRAASDANSVCGVGAQNKIFSNESFGDLLAKTGMFETYHETRERIRNAKLAASLASTKKLVRELRRRDLNDVSRDWITRVLNEVYPRLKGQLLSDELVLWNLGGCLVLNNLLSERGNLFREVTVRKRFREIKRHTGFFGGRHGLPGYFHCQHHERLFRSPLPHLLKQLKAIHPRHQPIADNKIVIKLATAKTLPSHFAVFR